MLYLLFYFLFNSLLISAPADSFASTQSCIDNSTYIISDDTVWTNYKENVKASYYGGYFNGRKTASGEIFWEDCSTCAHNKLPFGTLLRVTNIANDKSEIVRVTDRGGFTKYGRELDLSKGVMLRLDGLYSGVIHVKLERLTYFKNNGFDEKNVNQNN